MKTSHEMKAKRQGWFSIQRKHLNKSEWRFILKLERSGAEKHVNVDESLPQNDAFTTWDQDVCHKKNFLFFAFLCSVCEKRISVYSWMWRDVFWSFRRSPEKTWEGRFIRNTVMLFTGRHSCWQVTFEGEGVLAHIYSAILMRLRISKRGPGWRPGAPFSWILFQEPYVGRLQPIFMLLYLRLSQTSRAVCGSHSLFNSSAIS